MMSMIGSLARSGVVCRCFKGNSWNSSHLPAVWVPTPFLAFSSCYNRAGASSECFEYSWFRPIRFSLRVSFLSHDQLRAPSSLRDNFSWTEFENEADEKSRRRKSKILELIAIALGVAVIALSMSVLRDRGLARKPPLLRRTLKLERLMANDISTQESHAHSSRQLPARPASDSKFIPGRNWPLPSIVETLLQETPVKGGKDAGRLALGGTTSNLCTYVNLAEDQDSLEIDEEAFEQWLVEVKDTAVKRGIRESVVVQALQGIRPSKRIMELESNQPEVKLNLEAYLKNMINSYRVNKGVSGFQENELLLAEISSKYGVPSPVLVAIWGIESSYGGYSGNWDVLRALVTLAYASEEPRRAQFFKGELLQALQIIQEGHGPQSGERLRGSWAGAMGQCQFMPSSFQAYAVDYDGDGRKDIWESRADMFASMANYLKVHGWQRGGLIAQRVQIPVNVDKNLLGLKVQKSVQEWTSKYNVRIDKGQPEIPRHEMASLVAPDGPRGSAYLVFHNFRTIMRYNTSPLYTIAVWQLALQIIDGLGSTAAQFPELVSTLKC